ncbi:protein serine/threonine phosphatase 2C [Coprinopsis marcescibilis]|uniref:Protein serine/threonine phosphatase 2C n=1 Tax=Coprinopsis marcescibilis TaxID=230819 RepID=A0A5C3KTW0_COPMA|nr:protein serine/threonine phosphatase 2C [Coprinopsis marcescibilis]
MGGQPAVDFDVVLEGVSQTLSDNIIESELWKNSGVFCPPENDKTGIARVDGASVSVHYPAEEMLSTSFIPLQTHTWALFGLFDGEGGPGTSTFLSSNLLLAIAGSIADLMGKFYDTTDADPNTLGTPSSAQDAYGSASGEMMEMDSGPDDPATGYSPNRVIPFTPDIVRPFPPSEDIDQAIRDAFLQVDNVLVFEAVAQFFRNVQARTKQLVESDSGEGLGASYGVFTHGSKEEAVHLLRDAEAGSGALVAFYESDTRVLKVALAGDSRALLGRPVTNPQYRPAAKGQTTQEKTLPEPAFKKGQQEQGKRGSWWNPVVSKTGTENDKNRLLQPLPRSEYPTLYECTQLSTDQVPSNPQERQRISNLHPKIHDKLFIPNSDRTVTDPSANPSEKDSYLGEKTTRGFGYAMLKWGQGVQERLWREFLGDVPMDCFSNGSVPWPLGVPTSKDVEGPPPQSLPSSSSSSFPSSCASSPYMTAEPTITTTLVQPGDFIVLGSKGLFESLTDDEVVGLVGVWVEERKRRSGGAGVRNRPMAVGFGGGSSWGAAADGEGAVSMRDPESLIKGLQGSYGGGGGGGGEGSASRAGGGDPSEVSVPGWGWGVQSQGAVPSPTRLEDAAVHTARLIERGELPVIRQTLNTNPSSSSSGIHGRDGFRWYHSWGIPHSSSYSTKSVSKMEDTVKFVMEPQDVDSVAVHVIRNALGGADRDLRAGLVGMIGDRAKRFRDDVSVQIVFFD